MFPVNNCSHWSEQDGGKAGKKDSKKAKHKKKGKTMARAPKSSDDDSSDASSVDDSDSGAGGLQARHPTRILTTCSHCPLIGNESSHAAASLSAGLQDRWGCVHDCQLLELL